MANGLVTDTEIKFHLKQKHFDEKVHEENENYDRHAMSSRRHLDQEIRETRKRLKDINAKTSPIMQRVKRVPVINVSHHDTDSDNEADVSSTLDSNVRSHTLQNMRASNRLSRSLEKREQKRERSLSPLVSSLVSVSSRSIENLHKAACILKNTEHEKEVQKLLCSVQSKDKHA